VVEIHASNVPFPERWKVSSSDEELLAREDVLQAEARQFAADRDLANLLARLGRVIPVGSAVTGLMVWRDLDYTVDADGVTAKAVWGAVRPLLERCHRLVYADETGDRVAETAPYERHYFVFRIDGWKLDVSIWTNGAPAEVERYARQLAERLDDETRLAILRLKDAWHTRPEYPEIVGAFEIYEAVLEHGVRTPEQLERHLA
jgi:hypothetical protein